MFQSFFPKPKLFFLSAIAATIIAMIIWYFYSQNLGAMIGLPFPAEDAAPIIGNGFYFTNNFLTFYLYFFLLSAAFSAFWFKVSPHKWQLWSVFGSILIIFFTFFSVQVSVNLNNWRRPFFDMLIGTLDGKDMGGAEALYSGIYDFMAIAMVWVFIFVISKFFISHYIFRWRTAMNDYYVSRWKDVRTIEGASQRIQEDTMRFSATMEGLGASIVDSVMTLFAFLPILYGLSEYVPEIPIFGAVPHALMWAAIGWSIFGTAIMFIFGIKLPGLEFKNQRVEAAYRKELVYGEDDESRAQPISLLELFTQVRKNYFKLYFHYTYFNLARGFYLQANNVFAYFLLIPGILAASFTYGIMQQILTAFSQVASSFQYLVSSWPTIIELMSIHKRLAAFEAAIDGDELPQIDQDYLAGKN